MNIARLKQNLFSPSEKLQMKYTLWMNHLLVVYAFLLPISVQARAQVQFAIIILFFLRGNFKKYIFEHLKNPIVIAFALYFSLYILWLFGSDNPHYASMLIKHNKYAFFFPIIILSFIDKRFTSKVVSGFLIGIFFSEIASYLVSLHIISPSLSIYNVKIFHPYMSVYDPSPFMLHTKYGLALALAISLLLHNILTQKYTVIQKAISIFFLFSITFNISITGGRIGYILFVILILTLIILVFKKNSIKAFLISIASISIVFFIAYSNSTIFKNRIDYSISSISSLYKNPMNFNSSFGKRVGMWYYGGKVLKEHPIFGVGTGDHVDMIKEKIKDEHSNFKAVVHPHNQLVSVFIQFGIIGVLIFLNIFYSIFKYKKYASSYHKNIAILSSLSIFFMWMIEGDKVKFTLPLLITLVSISLANKQYNNFHINKNKKITILYIIIALLAFILAFFI